MPNIDITFNSKGFDRKAVDLAFREAVRDILAYAEDRAKVYAPRRTGNLQRNIGASKVMKFGNTYVGDVHVKQGAPYARWVESGTGIWGPYHRRITPTHGTVLKFMYRGKLMYRPSVRGQRGRHYMQLAYLDTNRLYVPYRLKKLKREIGIALTVT